MGAALHAGWNATLKLKLDPYVAMTLINFACAVPALPILWWFGMPARESWPWLGISLALYCAYYFTLSEAYRRADMSLVYPIARGCAPMLTALVSVLWLREPVHPLGIAGIALLGSGIMVMTLRPRSGAPVDRGGLIYAVLTAAIISTYTLSDGTGARLSGNPIGYSALLLVLNGIVPVALAIGMRGWPAISAARSHLKIGLAGGVMSYGAYTITIWAMTEAPIALVAAVREASVLFAAVIAVAVLKEPLRLSRIAGAALIVGGLVLIRLQ